MPKIIARLAPSPTGHLHLGNAWAFLLAWLSARKQQGQVILRLEDIDPQRSKPQFITGILKDLEWLGLDYDQAPILQSDRLDLYQEALVKLSQQNFIYPCFCTRKELRNLANAPQMGDLGVIYSGTCRNFTPAEQQLKAKQQSFCLRLRFPPGDFSFIDKIYGQQSFIPNDLALQRSDGIVAYHLATVLDDGLMGVTEIVRGQDILASTPWQLALQQLLHLNRPSYAHIPLLCDAHGERLAKRHQSLSLLSLKNSAILPESIIGYLAYKAGFIDKISPLSCAELLDIFSLDKFYQLNPQYVCLDADLNPDTFKSL